MPICANLKAFLRLNFVRPERVSLLNHTACFWLYRVPVLHFIMMHGFDTMTPTFIKCAYKWVPKCHGRGSDTVNVMAPHIAALFSLLIKRLTFTGLGKRPSWLLSKKRFSIESRKLQNDRSEWHAVQTVCQSIALYCSRLVWSTR